MVKNFKHTESFTPQPNSSAALATQTNANKLTVRGDGLK